MKFDFNTVNNGETTNMSEQELEKVAIKAQKRMQEWHDKKESGNLTDEEKQAVENTKKFMEFDGDPFTLSPEEFKAIFN